MCVCIWRRLASFPSQAAQLYEYTHASYASNTTTTTTTTTTTLTN